MSGRLLPVVAIGVFAGDETKTALYAPLEIFMLRLWKAFSRCVDLATPFAGVCGRSKKHNSAGRAPANNYSRKRENTEKHSARDTQAIPMRFLR